MGYEYSELVSDLEMGHEVEFVYKSDRYSISHNEKGWFLSKYYSQEVQEFRDEVSLLKDARIDSKTLKEIWNSVHGESVF